MPFITNLPWQTKILAKIVLSRIPSAYSPWQRLNLFKHGEMEKPSYAYSTFESHFTRVAFTRKDKGFVSLELGPGDSLFSALIAYALGGEFTYLVDVGEFAVTDFDRYHKMADFLRQKGFRIPKNANWQNLGEFLRECKAEYATEGLASLKKMPDESVDFIWSNAVLEHVRKGEFAGVLHELRRIIKPDGVCSHRIDLKDHLASALNSLRFSESLWESNLMARSGFYTNRIRFSQMTELFVDAGFSVEIIKVNHWSQLPTPMKKIHSDFSRLGEEELLTSGFDVILRPVIAHHDKQQDA